MNKEVIYIDVDDDITAIIGKIKASKSHIIALVPPKRIGALQSIVNLQLIHRAAENANKRLVLITTNKALYGLAAASNLPVAKSTQSKPEIPKLESNNLDSQEDVINGNELSVGDHVKMAGQLSEKDRDQDVASVLAKNEKNFDSSKKSKIPNFNKFRKRIVIISGLIIFLIGFLIWGFIIAPRATIVITAKTNRANLSKTVTLDTESNVNTNFDSNILKAIKNEKKKTESVEFEATGEKDAGEKATGTVKLFTNSISNLGITISEGTPLVSSSGLIYLTDKTVTFNINNYNNLSVGVRAKENGEKYNGASGSLTGVPSGVSAEFSSSTSGGVTKMVKIVSASDIQGAIDKLNESAGKDIKSELVSMFKKEVKVIDASYAKTVGQPKSTPAENEEATKAKLEAEVTHVMYGVDEKEIEKYLIDAAKESIKDQSDQKVYDDGHNNAKLTNFVNANNNLSVDLSATAKVGPDIDKNDIKKKAKGKNYGDIQANLEAIKGISDVDVKFFPFWISSVPDNDDKISIEFNVNE